MNKLAKKRVRKGYLYEGSKYMKKFLKFSKLIIIMAIIMINLIEYLFVNVSFADYPTGVYPHDTEPNPTMDEIDKNKALS